MNAALAIRDMIAPLLPADYEFQLDEWRDTTGAKVRRFAVLKHAGGGPAQLVRTPQFTLSLIGQAGGDRSEVHAHADAVVEAMRSSSGGLVYLEASEPVPFPTADGRPLIEIAISAITN